MEDSNEVTSHHEHYGVNLKPEWKIYAFREVINHCSLVDFGLMVLSSLRVIKDIWMLLLILD